MIQISEALHHQLKVLAAGYDRTMAEITVECLSRWVKARDKAGKEAERGGTPQRCETSA